MTFLGIDIDSEQRTLSLPVKKLVVLVEVWSSKRRATKRQLQVLVDKVN
jgi:hypothetical protein